MLGCKKCLHKVLHGDPAVQYGHVSLVLAPSVERPEHVLPSRFLQSIAIHLYSSPMGAFRYQRYNFSALCCRIEPYLIKVAPLRRARPRPHRAAALGADPARRTGQRGSSHRSDRLIGSTDRAEGEPSSSAVSRSEEHTSELQSLRHLV